MLELRLATPNGAEQVLPLQTELRVGRGPHNDVVLAHDGISWSHLVFRVADGVVLVEDLGSRNGTFINDARVANPTPLQPGSTVSVGRCTFRLQGSAASKPQGTLFLEDQITGVCFPLRDRFVLGDVTDADLRFSGDRVELTIAEGQVLLEGEPLPLPWEGALSGRAVRIAHEGREWSPTLADVGNLPLRTLTVTLEPPMARLDDLELDIEHTVRAVNRVTLLYFLATAFVADRKDGVPEERCGWRTDEAVTIGVWGRSGLDSSRNRLNTLLYRLRAEFGESGLPDGLIAKDAGWTRLEPMRFDFDEG